MQAATAGLDDALLAEIRQILAEETGQPPEAITDTQVLQYVELFLNDGVSPTPLHALFEAQVERTPTAVALVGPHRSWTYAELNTRANRLAHLLALQGLAPGAVAGVCLSAADWVVAVLAVLKAGAAVLPLDCDDPMPTALVRAGAALVLSGSPLAGLPCRELLLDSLVLDDGATENPQTCPLDRLALVLDTGRISIRFDHRALSDRGQWLQSAFPLSPGQEVLWPVFSPGSLVESLLPLTVGARLVYGDLDRPEQRLPGSRLHLTPSQMAAWLEKPRPPVQVFCSGEPLLQVLVDRFFAQDGGELFYLWGPPEVAVAATVQTCRAGRDRESVPAGQPAAVALYVLDEYRQPVPAGVSGEIHLAGAALASGYSNGSEAGPARLTDNPFGPGQLLATGEHGRLRSDGTLELSDSREIAWVRGQRVELGSVEAALRAELTVEDCAVLARTTEHQRQELVAYVVGAPFLPKQLNAALQAALPRAWVPVLIPLAVLPLTPAGQVDEVALLALPVIDDDLARRWVERLKLLSLEQVAVLLKPHPTPGPNLHLADLLEPADPVRTTGRPGEAPAVPQAPATDLALVNGGELDSDWEIQTLPEALQHAARTAPERGITYLLDDGSSLFHSFPQLWQDACSVHSGLLQLGLPPQAPVLLLFDSQPQLIQALWGCLLAGALPLVLPLPPPGAQGAALDRLLHTWQFLDRPLVLCSKVDCPTLDRRLPGVRTAAIEALLDRPPVVPGQPARPDDLALLNLTSGSTGTPKCVPLSHNNLLARAHGTNQLCHHTADDVVLNWLPFDHIGSLSDWHLRCVLSTCAMVYLTKQAVLTEPLHWLALIDRHRVTHSWAPNFAFALVNRALKLAPHLPDWDLSCLKRLLNAGEAVAAPVIEEFVARLRPCGLAPTVLQPAFGMAELGSGVTYFQPVPAVPLVRYSLDKAALTAGCTVRPLTAADPAALTFVELGPPIAGVSLRIVDDCQRVLPERTVGALQVRGSAVFSGYYRNQQATDAVLSAEGWFDTGDLGFLSGGALVVVGREKESIVLRGANYYSHDIEQVVETVAGVEVSYTAACAVRGGEDGGEGLAVFFSLSAGSNLAEVLGTIRKQVAERVGVAVDYLVPVTKLSVPKTTIGKIQRGALRERFESGEFAGALKQVDVLLANRNTLGDWFYRRHWRRRPVPRARPAAVPGALVFADTLGLAEAVGEHLPGWVRVEAGVAFARLAERRYCIDPADPEHYRRLLGELSTDGIAIGQILHLWTYGERQAPEAARSLEQAQQKGAYSVLALVQALITGSERGPVRLRVASSGVQPVWTDRPAWEHGGLFGLLKTAGQEFPWLDCRHVDLPLEAVALNSKRLISELESDRREREVTYRRGERWVSRLEKVDMVRAVRQPVPLREGGLYLVSGGLGGIGLEVAKYLLQHYRARLLIVGRSIASPEQLQPLAGLGGEVLYAAADLCCPAAVEAAVARARAHWEGCPLDGIFHLAGVYREQLLIAETQAEFEQVLRSRLVGSWVLDQLLSERPEALFVSFASVSGYFGAAGLAAYAAANSLQEAFSAYQRASGRPHSYCFSWSIWDELGMSRGNPHKAAVQARGFQAIAVAQGINSLLVGLRTGEPQLLIGLDDSKAGVRQHLETRDLTLSKLVAYCTAQRPDAAASAAGLKVADRFGQASSCEVIQVPVLPRTADGAIDRQKLLGLGATGVPERVAPRNDLERQLARLWQDVLGGPEPGIDDNFFSLGGSSLMLTQLVSRIRDALRLDLPLQVLFGSPTLAGMAKLLLTRQLERQDKTKMARLLQEVKNLTPEQIKALLQAKTQR